MRQLVNEGNPFRFADAERLGFTRWSLSRAVGEGLLQRPLRGVYVDITTPDTRDLRILCLRLVMPPYGVVCERTAAWLYGISGFAPEDQAVLTPEFAVPHHRGRSGHGPVRTVEAVLPQSAIAEMGGLRVTTPLRTATDLGRRLRRPMALAALDAFAHSGLVTPHQLMADLDRWRGFPGIVQLRDLVRAVEPNTESPGESWLRLRLLDAGFPRPRAQIEIIDAFGQVVFRLDLGYEDRRIGLEYDGREYHEGLAAVAHDERRRTLLRSEHGWDVYGFTREHVLGRRDGLELFVGGLLGIEPRLPRRW